MDGNFPTTILKVIVSEIVPPIPPLVSNAASMPTALPQCRWISFPPRPPPLHLEIVHSGGLLAPSARPSFPPPSRRRPGHVRREGTGEGEGRGAGKPRAPHSLPATLYGFSILSSPTPRKGAAGRRRRCRRCRHFFIRSVVVIINATRSNSSVSLLRRWVGRCHWV